MKLREHHHLTYKGSYFSYVLTKHHSFQFTIIPITKYPEVSHRNKQRAKMKKTEEIIYKKKKKKTKSDHFKFVFRLAWGQYQQT